MESSLTTEKVSLYAKTWAQDELKLEECKVSSNDDILLVRVVSGMDIKPC